jgi:N4-gp56 family major capsid protein
MGTTKDLIPEIWSASILRNFEKTSVFADVLNREYTSDLSSGNKVKIPRILPVSARTYAEGTPIVYDDVLTSTVDLELDQQKYFALKVSDIDVVQANAPFLAATTKNASYALRDTIDKYCGEVLADAAGIKIGTAAAPISVNTAGISAILFDIGQKMNEANVPTAGRWIVVPPWFYKKLALAGINLTAISDTSKVYADGYLGKVAGFDLYVSNNAPKDGDTFSILAGTNESGSLVVQIDKIEELRDRDSFSSLVRGLSVYGAACTQTTATAVVFVEEDA